MIKKIILFIMCLVILTSCGRKGCPKYEDAQDDTLYKQCNEIY
jgi:predicted small lipoprotein YifL